MTSPSTAQFVELVARKLSPEITGFEYDILLDEQQAALRARVQPIVDTYEELTKAPFQDRVKPWMLACFGETVSADKIERNHRFLEEALELVQACGCSREECRQLVDYVFGRPDGDVNQEVGGVMVTLAALCLANGIDMHEGGETELKRIWGKIEQIRAKQAGKPKNSPLPQAQDAPTTPLIAKVSAALRKAAIAEWPDTADIVVIEGYPDDLAQVAVDVCCVGEMVEALNRLTSAVGTMLNVYLADEEDDIELCHDTEHHLAILELRDAFNAGTNVERTLLAKIDGKPTEQSA